MRLITISVLFATTVLSGCNVASCETNPLAHGVVATVRAPAVAPPALAIAACVPRVTYDDNSYAIVLVEWRVTDASLTEIGEASGANLAAGSIDDRRVFSIERVDPTIAVAMRLRSEDRPVLLVREGQAIPSGVCRFLIGPERGACEAPAPSD